MDKLLKTFKNKKFRYGTFSALTAAVIIILLLFVNLIASRFVLKLDLTPSQFFTLSEETKKVLDDAQHDITIYELYVTGAENTAVDEMLDQYVAHSNRINVIMKDPYLYPRFVDDYKATPDEVIPTNSLIVVNNTSGKFKIITEEDMVTQTFSYTTFSYETTSIDVEPKITNAIEFVQMDVKTNLYFVSNHRERVLDPIYSSKLIDAGFTVDYFDLYQQGGIPEDCDILVITSPASDYSKEEVEYVKAWLENNGKAMLALDYTCYPMPNIRSLATAYGVDINEYIIFEGDIRMQISAPIYFYPLIAEHEMTASILASKASPVFTLTTGLTILDERRDTLTYTPLFSTTESSYGKPGDSATLEREATDVAGPFLLATEINDRFWRGPDVFTTKLLAVSTTMIFSQELDEQISGKNSNLIVQMLSYLSDKPSTSYVPSKAVLSVPQLDTITQSNVTMLKIIAVLIPLAIFTAGIIVWYRRRAR